MRAYHITGNKQGKPAYRTPSWFKINKIIKNCHLCPDENRDRGDIKKTTRIIWKNKNV